MPGLKIRPLETDPEQLLQRIHELEAQLEQFVESRRFFDTLLENIPSMIFVKEVQELRFVHINKAGEQLLGFGRDELLGKNDYDFFPKEQADYFTAKDREVFEKGVPTEINEEPIQTRDGQKYLRTRKVPILDESGKPLYLLGISEDITETKRTEQERDRLRSQREMSRDFISALSHDLRAPLTAARASAELIRRFPERTDMMPKLTNTVVDNLSRADRMIKDLLDANRIEAGRKLQLKLTEFDLVALAQSVTTEFSLIYPNHFVVDAPESLEGRWGEDELRRLMENLCSNASKYGNAGGDVTVRLIPMGHSVQIRVHNHGSFIPEDKRAILFEKYYRWDGTNPESKRGWGLGLIVVKGVAESHGGRVFVESDPDRGTTFVAEIPRFVELPFHMEG